MLRPLHPKDDVVAREVDLDRNLFPRHPGHCRGRVGLKGDGRPVPNPLRPANLDGLAYVIAHIGGRNGAEGKLAGVQ